jgi:hypothetical protein
MTNNSFLGLRNQLRGAPIRANQSGVTLAALADCFWGAHGCAYLNITLLHFLLLWLRPYKAQCITESIAMAVPSRVQDWYETVPHLILEEGWNTYINQGHCNLCPGVS